MNLCVKKTYLSREIEVIHFTNKQTILIHFKDTDRSISEHIDITLHELNRISSFLFHTLGNIFSGDIERSEIPDDYQKKLLDKPDQDNPDDS